MSLWSRFRKSPPGPPPAPPDTPADGTIEAFDLADAMGTIRLATGETLRFGRSSCSFEPVAGLAVRVVAAEVGPLSMPRATRVELCGDIDAHERLLDARDRESGLPARGRTNTTEGLHFGTLAITTRDPVADRSALREVWIHAGLDEVAKLEFDPGPVAQYAGRTFRVLFGGGPLESTLDLRFRPQGALIGRGFVALREDLAPKLARKSGPGAGNAWGFGPSGSARDLLDLVSRLARCGDVVTGVVLTKARATWLTREDWLRRVGDYRNPEHIPVEAFIDVARCREGDGAQRLRSFGLMLSLALPDVEIDDPRAAEDHARHRLCEHVAWAACRLLATEDALHGARSSATLPIGETVKVRIAEGLVSFRVVGFTDDEEHTLRLAEVTLLDA